MKESINRWLDNIEKTDGIPPAEVLAFNFGIFESDEGYKLYLVGGFEYSEDNDDWAAIEMPKKDHRYMKLPDEVQEKDWEEVLELVAGVLQELEEEGALKRPLLAKAIAITTGFDDGDLVKIR